jgi:hypothetical protein
LVGKFENMEGLGITGTFVKVLGKGLSKDDKKHFISDCCGDDEVCSRNRA